MTSLNTHKSWNVYSLANRQKVHEAELEAQKLAAQEEEMRRRIRSERRSGNVMPAGMERVDFMYAAGQEPKDPDPQFMPPEEEPEPAAPVQSRVQINPDLLARGPLAKMRTNVERKQRIIRRIDGPVPEGKHIELRKVRVRKSK